MAESTDKKAAGLENRLYRFAFQEMDEAMVTLDRGRRIFTWSRGAVELLGYEAQEAVGKPFESFLDASLQGQYRAIFKTAPGGQIDRNLQWSMVHKGGFQTKVLATLYRLSGESDDAQVLVIWMRPYGSSAVQEIQDPTMRDILLRMQQLSATGQIAAALAHQIRTPLHVIQSTAEFIEDQLSPDSPHLEGLHVVNRNVERITALTNALAAFTRYKKHLFAPGDLNKVVDQVCLFIEMLCKKQGVRLKKSLGAIPPVNLDADYLIGGLYNLMGNAVESMPEGGVLSVTTAKRERDVLLTITDTGAGMSPLVLEQIGHPFFTTKATGTGLGMFVAREILEQHRATLRIESKEGVGTRMEIAFPGS